MTFNQHQQCRAHLPGTSLPSSTALNHESKQQLKLITKNGSIHLGLVEEHQASPAPTDAIQLELDLKQATNDHHWHKPKNNYSQPQDLLSQFSNHQLQQLRRAPTLDEKDQLISKFNHQNGKVRSYNACLDDATVFFGLPKRLLH